MKKLSIIAALLISANLLNAKVELPSVISDNMVLQQNTDVALWGKAKPGSKVTVKPEWTNEKFTTNADKVTGKWLLRVKTPYAGGPYEINFNDGEEIKVSNVLIGEVSAMFVLITTFFFPNGALSKTRSCSSFERRP